MKLSPVHVLIKSYQSIEELEFDVAGFTCVTGKTNIGKSAILRAISGALLNKPVTNLVRAGAKSCAVQLRSDRWGLLWEKAEKGLNRYTIDGKAERLENVGQRQPEPVSAMGFSSVRIGDKDLYPWYASQWTPVFLLDDGGPSVTQFISEISGLDVLQNAISLGLKGKKKALDDCKLASSEADQFKTKLKKVDKLDELVTMVDELKSQSESIAEYETRVSRGKELNEAIETAVVMIDVLQDVARARIPPNGMGGEISTTLDMYRRWLKLEEAAKSVIALRGEPVKIPEVPNEHDKWTKIRKYVDVDPLRSSVKKLEPIMGTALPKQLDKSEFDRMKRARTLSEQIGKLNKSVTLLNFDPRLPDEFDDAVAVEKTIRAKNILSETNKTRSDMTTLGKSLAQTDKSLNEVLDELKSIPSCPTCNRPVNSGHLHG